jgi:hypothetical protein
VLVRARLAWNGRCLESVARIFVGPPDFAPDRRPFYSLADEFADRDNSSYPNTGSFTEKHNYVFDLFRRVFETSMLINVDRYRLRLISPGAEQVGSDLPRTDEYSMRKRADGESAEDDRNFMSDVAQIRLQDPASEDADTRPNTHLVRANLAREAHEVLANPQALLDEMFLKKDMFSKLIRPPFKAFADLPVAPGAPAGIGERRDVRVDRDRAHDMRMPPYMRDSDASALSLTERQYGMLKEFIDDLTEGGSASARLHRNEVLKRRENTK